MSFIFPAILGGLLLAGIPILLHLIMRQKPKVLPFPAFRFLVPRSKTNLRKLRLRHLLLLLLRVLILAAICLALARPKLVSSALSLSSDRPVAAIFLFDTSYSMSYMTSEKVNRLDEAQKRGLELLNELPEGSKVAILDTAEAVASRGEWLTSANQARERIKGLKLRPANGPVTARLIDAYRMFAELARTRDEEPTKDLPRFLCVFSDRTRASWDLSRQNEVFDAADEVPPTSAGLHKFRDDVPGLIDALKELRQKLPPAPGQDYPEQALIDALVQLRERIGGLTSEDLPGDRELKKQLGDVRRPARQLLATLQKPAADPAPEKDYRDKLVAALQTGVGYLRGVYAVFVDVGVERPSDLAIMDLQFPRARDGRPRQVFAGDKKFVLLAVVQATGKDYNTTLKCQVGKQAYEQPVVLKAAEKQTFEFEIDIPALKLPPGDTQLKVELGMGDLLPFNNQRFANFAVREPRRILVLADDPGKAGHFVKALDVNGFSATARPVSSALKPPELSSFQAVYLFDVAEPSSELWDLLDEFVKRGGGLGIIPGGREVNTKAYHQPAAEKLMPGQMEKPVVLGDLLKKEDENKVVIWNLGQDAIFQHPLMRPFRDWRAGNFDLIRAPRRVACFWEVQPYAAKSAAIVHYTDPQNRPALYERLFDKDKGRVGRVLLFTTTFDEGRQPAWNDYLTFTNSFYVVIAGLATQYLAGDTEEPRLNFQSGQTTPVVSLPVSPRFPDYSLRGPDVFERVAVDIGQNDLVLRQAVAPGNYVLEGFKGEENVGRPVAAFSVNIPPEESNLTRVPPAEIESMFGTGAVVPVDRRTPIRDALQGHWNQPIELFPFLMVLLLLVLALENLLANKFYKKEEEAPAEHSL
jgi:Aerotolerance regulator N-terminal